jgi:hypothetical protein
LNTAHTLYARATSRLEPAKEQGRFGGTLRPYQKGHEHKKSYEPTALDFHTLNFLFVG